MKQLYTMIILAGMALLLPACVHDMEPVFDKSASARMAEANQNAKKVLVSEPNCWHMEYYPHSEQAYGGYDVFVKFTEDEVTAWGEVAESLDKSYTSLYKLTTDDGPVLSFDMFNYVLHYFSTPSGSSMKNIYGQTQMYQAYEGDFEFLILKAAADEVLLKGKRSGCLIRMTPFSGNPVEYLQATEAGQTDNFRATIQGTPLAISTFHTSLDGVGYQLEMDRDMRQVYFTKDGAEESTPVAFMYTPDGIKFYQPFTVGDASVSELVWDKTRECAVAGGLTLENRVPEGWLGYNQYLGTYTLTYNDNEDWYIQPKTATFTLVPDEEGKSYLMKGVSDKYDVKVNYDLAGGVIVIMGQIVGKYGDNDVFFAAHYASRSATGGITYTGWRGTSYGIKIKVDPESVKADPDHFKAHFIPGPSSAGRGINSFGLLMQTPAGASGGWMRPGSADDHQYDDWFIFGDSYVSFFWRDMVKQ